MKRILGLLFLLAPCSAWAAGEVFYVCPVAAEYGTELGTSQANCFDGFTDITWNAGNATSVDAADTLYVCGAHTTEKLSIGVSGSASNIVNIRFDCPGNAGSISEPLDASGTLIDFNGKSYVTVWYPRISRVPYTGGNGYGITMGLGSNNAVIGGVCGPCDNACVAFGGATVSNVLVDGIEVYGCTDANWGGINSITSGASLTMTNIIVRNTYVHDNVGYGINLTMSGAAIDSSAFAGLTLTGNTVTGNSTGITAFGGRGDVSGGAATTDAAWSTNLTLTNNLVYNNTLGNVGGSGYGVAYGAWDGFYIARNTVYGNKNFGGQMSGTRMKNGIWELNVLHDGVQANGIDNSGLLIDRLSHNNIVRRNYIYNFNGAGLTDSTDAKAGIYLTYSDGNAIYGNIIVNSAIGIQIADPTAANNTIGFNTIVAGPLSEIGMRQVTGGNSAPTLMGSFYNNIFYGDFPVTTQVDISQAAWDYNVIYGSSGGGQTPGQHDITADPLFVGANMAARVAAGSTFDPMDFRLQPDSPARRTGKTIGGYVDYRGCRVQSPPSIGAFEACRGD